MICKDCDEEVEELTKLGVCKRCYRRIEQLEYLNRKNKEKKVYIPLNQLKSVNINAYNRIMGRRNSTDKKHNIETKAEKILKKEQKENKNDLKLNYYTKVSKDLSKAFEDNNLTDDYTKYDLVQFIDTLIALTRLDDNNIINQCKKGERIFNDMVNLYRHQKENLDWSNSEEIINISYAEKALNELRRPTKNILDYYYCISPIIEYLKKDNIFMDALFDAKNQLYDKKQYHESPKYISNIDSDLVNDDFIIKYDESKNNKTKLYDCTVWCYNLNGNPEKQLFKANGGIYAKNETEAKLKLKTFLNEKFASLSYADNDIFVKEME